jgi:hypothetical protein
MINTPTPQSDVQQSLCLAHVHTWRERLASLQQLRQLRDSTPPSSRLWDALLDGICALKTENEQRERRIIAAGGLLYLVAP